MAHDYEPYIRDDWSAEDEMHAQCADEEASYRYHHEIINTYCDLCSVQGRGTGASLRAAGWSFAQGAEFCPSH